MLFTLIRTQCNFNVKNEHDFEIKGFLESDSSVRQLFQYQKTDKIKGFLGSDSSVRQLFQYQKADRKYIIGFRNNFQITL